MPVGISYRAMLAAAGSSAAADAYIVNSFAPPVVADFAGVLNSGTEYYRVGGVDSDFSSMFTFSRASSATQTNSSGNLVSVSSGVARRNHYRYNGTSFVNKGILLESNARTNLVTQSNDFSTTWLQSAAGGFTLTAADSTGPDGTASMTKLAITDTTNEKHRLYISVTGSTSAVTQSFYIKPGTLQYIALRMYNASGGTNYGWATSVYDMSGLTVTDTQTGSGGTGSITHNGSGIESVGGGIYRIWISTTGVFTTDHTAMIMAVSGATPTLDSVTGDESFAGTTGQYVHIYGAQYEVGSTPSSYIPTSGATVTRAAETLTIAAANMSGHAGDVSMHQQSEVFAKMSSTNTFLGIWGSGTLYVSPTNLLRTSSVGVLRSLLRNAGSFVTDEPVGALREVAECEYVDINAAIRYDYGTELEFARNGTATGTPTSTATLVNTTSLDYYFHEAGQTNMHQTIALFRQWAVDIGDTGIESATS